jgi:2-polyprenyl-3-methyl-5-hydroxy-6-metoxy-1,4-benzoquinol methylase
MNKLTYRERMESLNAVGLSAKPSESHYRECARQYRSRWGSWLPADRATAFLDLGCGCGEWLYFLRQQGYENTVGIDVSTVKMDFAKAMGLGNAYKFEAVEFLNQSKNGFDVITAFNFFEHLAKNELLDVMQLIYEALRPGGRVFAITPNGLSPFSGATRYWDFSHEQSFTPASWRQIAASTGFEEVQFEEYGPMAHSLPGAIRASLWFGIRSLIKFVNYVEVGGPRGEAIYTADMKIILIKK